jgi:hypothetical protein
VVLVSRGDEKVLTGLALMHFRFRMVQSHI